MIGKLHFSGTNRANSIKAGNSVEEYLWGVNKTDYSFLSNQAKIRNPNKEQDYSETALGIFFLEALITSSYSL